MAALCSGAQTVLRPVTRDDLPALAAWDADPEIVALMGRKFNDEHSTTQWFERVLSDPRCRALAIETHTGRLIGELELEHINWRRATAEVRICIGEHDYWSAGYGTDALRAALNLAFSRWRLRTVYLRVYASNRRAIRAYEKCGFRREAVMAPSERRSDPDAVVLMTLTRERFAHCGMTAPAVAVGH